MRPAQQLLQPRLHPVAQRPEREQQHQQEQQAVHMPTPRQQTMVSMTVATV